MALIDNHGRTIDYARIAVTDQCNLRCTYCMPEQGLNWLKKDELLTQDEIHKLIQNLAFLGVKKIRFTGGEPFLRKDFLDIVKNTKSIQGISEITITTNGTYTEPYIQELVDLGIKSINLSVDTLDPVRFKKMARRDWLPQVQSTFHRLLDSPIQVKLNAVIMAGQNEEDIEALSKLAISLPVDIRFIEEMPFNGSGINHSRVSAKDIESKLFELYPALHKLPMKPTATSQEYSHDDFKGKIGIIAAYSRTFCGSCNRIRITPSGHLKTCLYDKSKNGLKPFLNNNSSDFIIREKIIEAVGARFANGFDAEKHRTPIQESMASIGG
jgi:cyclic pyranopterin phosphate synthase